MSDLVVYYGTERPVPSWSTSVVDTDVVLQPYHPMVQESGFRTAFPRARRFVYVNPTTIDPWRLERRSSTPPLTEASDDWGLPRLDLHRAAGWECSIEEAASAAASGSDELDGLFVDDADRIDAEQFARFTADVSDRLGWLPRLFVNRGFALWATAPAIDAVLIEDVRGTAPVDHDDDGAARWMREVIAPAVARISERAARVHRIEYSDTAAHVDVFANEVSSSLVDSEWMTATRPLNTWPAAARGTEHQ